MKTATLLAFVIGCLFLVPSRSFADNAGKAISVSDGNISLTAPKGWVAKQPRVKFIDHEFAVPATEGDATDGRVTIMGAGGSIDANVTRWIGQFQQPDGSSTKDKATIKKLSIGGNTIHFVDISGTFRDQRGPFAPATLRKDYRMLAIIILTEKRGQYFVKLYGPKKTVAANAAAFDTLIKSIKIK